MDTFAATVAIRLMDFRQKICRVDRLKYPELACGDHGLAAAPAAITDEAHLALIIFSELNEIVFIGIVERLQALICCYGTCISVFRERCGGKIKCHTDIHRCVARSADVVHFMSAVACTYADMCCRLDDFTGTFVVHNVKGMIVG